MFIDIFSHLQVGQRFCFLIGFKKVVNKKSFYLSAREKLCFRSLVWHTTPEGKALTNLINKPEYILFS